MPKKRIINTGKRQPKIINASKKMPKVSIDDVAKALGAEKMTEEQKAKFLRKQYNCAKIHDCSKVHPEKPKKE